MHRFIVSLVACFALASTASAQLKKSSAEFGVSLGSCSFLGDLGGSRDIGRALLYDLDLLATRPVVGIIFRKNLGRKMAFRLNAYFAQVWGDDAYANTDTLPGDPAWSRRYRNLSFKSIILEGSMILDYNFMPFEAGSLRYRFTPYICGGIGVFTFNPRARYNGAWVNLRDYHTEGQGFAQLPEKQVYSTIAIAFPLGGGIKYNLSKKYGFSFEVAHRLTTTDYIDDVSTTYIDPALFYANLPLQEAQIAEALADRSNHTYPEKTSAGQQRGDPSDKDGYMFSGVLTLTYTVSYSDRKFFCPTGLK